MEAELNKILTLLIVLIGFSVGIKAHTDRFPGLSSSESSSGVESMQVLSNRRSVPNEWQYEGLPIEFPSNRRTMDNDVKETKSMQVLSNRRSVPKEWQYEGLPIEFPFNRRTMDNDVKETTITTTSTTPVYPPLDPRYRRVYNPDEETSIADYPFMAALLVNQQLWCGAVIIARDTVLTAAHCLQLQYNNRFFREYVKMLTVRVGSSNATSGGEVLRVLEIFFHPNYKPHTLEFNFAALKLHKNLTFGRSGQEVAMVQPSVDRLVPVDKTITFLGWGSVLGVGGSGGSVLLQRVELPVYDLSDCQEIYGRDLVTRSNFCAGYITIPKNVCNHDAGGPAIMDNELIGILSFSSKRCDQPDQPAVFSTVGVAAPWLEKLGELRMKFRH